MINNYNNKAYAKWRSGILKRDKYTCQSCDKVGGSLNVHHVNEKRKVASPDEEGITLCIKCHMAAHKRK